MKNSEEVCTNSVICQTSVESDLRWKFCIYHIKLAFYWAQEIV